MTKVKWVTGAAVLACAGALLAWQAGAGTASVAEASTGKAHGAVATVRTAGAAGPSARTRKTDPALSGKRQVTIVRAQSFEGGLSLLDGKLVEVDDDSGRQLFVPTPIGGGRYLIKAYQKANGHPAADEPLCWQEHNPHSAQSLTVEGALCDKGNAAQWFTISSAGKGTYAISNNSAFLQFSPTSGLILEELGDAPLLSTFRLVDNGPARAPVGG
jgi:hypothetical protein